MSCTTKLTGLGQILCTWYDRFGHYLLLLLYSYLLFPIYYFTISAWHVDNYTCCRGKSQLPETSLASHFSTLGRYMQKNIQLKAPYFDLMRKKYETTQKCCMFQAIKKPKSKQSTGLVGKIALTDILLVLNHTVYVPGGNQRHMQIRVWHCK